MSSRGEGVAAANVVAPATTPTTIERAEVWRRLDLGARRFTVVVADAGFGKTTALAGWARQSAAAWYTVDTRDRDAARFVPGLGVALRMRHPALAGVVEVAAGPQGGRRSRALALAGALCEAIAGVGPAR